MFCFSIISQECIFSSIFMHLQFSSGSDELLSPVARVCYFLCLNIFSLTCAIEAFLLSFLSRLGAFILYELMELRLKNNMH